MLVSLSEILSIAEQKQCAIGAFDTPGLANILAVVDAAEKLNVPVILMHAQVHENICPLSIVGPAIIAAAKQAKVPVCAHLDHGEDISYIKEAISMGFTSVMYDGSVLPYADNVRNTCEVVEYAHSHHVSVEAEIGCLGKRETGDNDDEEEDLPVIYTTPDEAFNFVKATNIDALACSFGSAHGLYLKKPELNFSVLENIRKKIKTPLVMHGGSGITVQDYAKAIMYGIRKINYYTYMVKAGGEAIKQDIKQRIELHDERPVLYHNLFNIAKRAMSDDVYKALEVFTHPSSYLSESHRNSVK